MEGILQGSTAHRGRLQQGRHSWPQAEQSLAGAVRHCQTGEGRRTGVPCTPLPRGCREQQVTPAQGEGSCSVWDRDPIQMGMLTAQLAVPTTSRGLRKRPSTREDGAPAPPLPDSAEEGASKHQPLQRWGSQQLVCDQESNRPWDIHLDTSIF